SRSFCRTPSPNESRVLRSSISKRPGLNAEEEMIHISPHALPLTVAVAALAERRFTARALAEAQLACIDATDSQIDAWATLDRAHVQSEADRCDLANASGLLAGIGIGVKAIIATRAMPTGMGSPICAEPSTSSDAAC